MPCLRFSVEMVTFQVSRFSVFQVSIANLLSPSSGLRITSAVEMTATGGVPLASLKPVAYRVDGRADPVVMPQVPAAPSGVSLDVTLSPMQVRTFMCGIEPSGASF